MLQVYPQHCSFRMATDSLILPKINTVSNGFLSYNKFLKTKKNELTWTVCREINVHCHISGILNKTNIILEELSKT